MRLNKVKQTQKRFCNIVDLFSCCAAQMLPSKYLIALNSNSFKCVPIQHSVFFLKQSNNWN